MNNPLGVSPSKVKQGNRESNPRPPDYHRVRSKKFSLQVGPSCKVHEVSPKLGLPCKVHIIGLH